MAEEKARERQYEYRATASLVLQADRSGARNNEPTGEVESLKDHIHTMRMGDKAMKGRSTETDERKKKGQLARERKEQREGAEKKRRGERDMLVMSRGATVITETDDMDAMYRPKTKDTARAYEGILNFIRKCIGDQPQDILRGAAEEAISLLKDDRFQGRERQAELEKVRSAEG
jgi:pre-mRNA-splicing helicase BRR2